MKFEKSIVVRRPREFLQQYRTLQTWMEMIAIISSSLNFSTDYFLWTLRRLHTPPRHDHVLYETPHVPIPATLESTFSFVHTLAGHRDRHSRGTFLFLSELPDPLWWCEKHCQRLCCGSRVHPPYCTFAPCTLQKVWDRSTDSKAGIGWNDGLNYDINTHDVVEYLHVPGYCTCSRVYSLPGSRWYQDISFLRHFI